MEKGKEADTSRLKRIYRKHNNQKIKRWTKEESDLYSRFIADHANLLRDPSVKRAKKIFILMSNFIKTKNPSQCRSHHQKFYRKEGSDTGEASNNTAEGSLAPQNNESLINSKENEKIFLKKEENINFLSENGNYRRERLRNSLNNINNNKGAKVKVEEEKKEEEEEIVENINKLNEKELEDFICSAKMLFSVGSQMCKLRRNFEEFEEKNLRVFKESCNFYDFFYEINIYLFSRKSGFLQLLCSGQSWENPKG